VKQVVLRSHPAGVPRASDFSIDTVAMPTPPDGGVLLRTIWLSLDPMNRLALDATPLMGSASVGLGEVMCGSAVSEVVASHNPEFEVGCFVEGRTGWREYAAVDPTAAPLRKVDAALAPLSTALGVLGMPGRTAHACMIGAGRVTAGETVVISAAAGGVGSLAGQIGKILGARVVGIAGGAQKCAALEVLGFDACVDYRAPNFAADLKAACPGGVDVYIENVGGAVTDAVLPLLKYGARMPVCGFISYYSVGKAGPGSDRLPGFMRTVLSKGLEVRGFAGAVAAGANAFGDLARWLREGRIVNPEAIVPGLENAPAAFASIFSVNNHVGKLLVRVEL
jgi:NADPH-dependent curcumin reductase